MSTSPRSLSSSPDILGPSGDAQYLISSPAKLFNGQQSWMSPMVGKARSRTPAKRSRSRVSPSPAKSAHSIQFNDVILPGSPTMKFNGGRQRSISPEKLLQDGNVSPWRIRLTLEATQDEENRDSPSRKRLKPSTVTTMIPLKDEGSPLMEKTPLRRRGRPRKSEMTDSPYPGRPGHTPRPGRTPGPGNTPGPGDTPGPGHTPGLRDPDSQSRNRNYPRDTPKLKELNLQMFDDQPTPTVEDTESFSPMDVVPNSDFDSRQQPSPMDIVASDAVLEPRFDSLGGVSHESGPDHRHYSPVMTMNSDANPGETFSPTDSFAGSNAHASPIDLVGEGDSNDSWGNSEISVAEFVDPTAPITQNIEETRREYGRTSLETPVIGATEHHFLDDDNVHSTPSKMPSPTRERAIQSSRSSHNTASPQSRTYPTPTPTSSLADEENQPQEHDGQHTEPDAQPAEKDMTEDPLGDHAEYEEYDTIVESEGFTMISLDTLPSAKQHGFGSSAVTNGDPKSKEVGDRLRRKLPGTIEDLRNNTRDRTPSSQFTPGFAPEPHDRTEFNSTDQNSTNRPSVQTDGDFTVNYMHDITYPKLPAVFSPAQEKRQKPNHSKVELGPEEVDQGESLEEEIEEQPFEYVIRNQKQTLQSPHIRPNYSMRQSPIYHQKRDLEEQWQLEREAVSRKAQRASRSRSPVYIDSDDSMSEKEEVYQPETERTHRNRPQSEAQEPEDFETESFPEPVQYTDSAADFQPEPLEGEDDDVDDIWQLEANDNSYDRQSEDENIAVQPIQAQTPLGSIKATRLDDMDERQMSLSPDDPSKHHNVAHFGPSKIRELREQPVDLSALLAEEYTPNRAQYYNGTSTPRSALRPPPGTQHSPLPSSIKKQPVSRTPAHVRLQPLSQNSPEVESPQISFQEWENSPEVTHQSPAEEQSVGIDDFGSSNAVPSKPEPAALGSGSTPRHNQVNENTPGSSWVSKITSFTPQWLKAPTRARSSSVTTIPEEQSESEQEDDLIDIEPAKEIDQHLRDESLSKELSQSPASHWREVSRSPQASQSFEAPRYLRPPAHEEQPKYEVHLSSGLPKEHEEPVSERGSPHEVSRNEDAEPVARDGPSSETRPLATFGYFSDDHYGALRRIYRIAKRYPERFEYHDTPGRAAIIGDWIWTSNGRHGVPITEIQFAIIDRFAQGLSRADIQYGGSGQVDWTEADLHRRLISIIIGEQIREERKAKTGRGTSVDP